MHQIFELVSECRDHEFYSNGRNFSYFCNYPTLFYADFIGNAVVSSNCGSGANLAKNLEAREAEFL